MVKSIIRHLVHIGFEFVLIYFLFYEILTLNYYNFTNIIDWYYMWQWLWYIDLFWCQGRLTFQSAVSLPIGGYTHLLYCIGTSLKMHSI